MHHDGRRCVVQRGVDGRCVDRFEPVPLATPLPRPLDHSGGSKRWWFEPRILVLADRTAFLRIAIRLGLTLPAFHVGNFFIHLLPCALVVAWERPPPTLLHGILATCLHFGWGLFISRGTLVLDDVYVPLPRRTWLLLWVVAIIAPIVTPFGVGGVSGAFGGAAGRPLKIDGRPQLTERT